MGSVAVLDLLAAPCFHSRRFFQSARIGHFWRFCGFRLACPVSAASCKATTALTRFYDLHVFRFSGLNPDIQGPVAVLDLLAAPGVDFQFGPSGRFSGFFRIRLACPVSAASCKATTALTRFYDLHANTILGLNPDIQGPVAVLDLLAAFRFFESILYRPLFYGAKMKIGLARPIFMIRKLN